MLRQESIYKLFKLALSSTSLTYRYLQAGNLNWRSSEQGSTSVIIGYLLAKVSTLNCSSLGLSG